MARGTYGSEGGGGKSGSTLPHRGIFGIPINRLIRSPMRAPNCLGTERPSAFQLSSPRCGPYQEIKTRNSRVCVLRVSRLLSTLREGKRLGRYEQQICHNRRILSTNFFLFNKRSRNWKQIESKGSYQRGLNSK